MRYGAPVLRHALLTGLWGGLVALERRAFLQAMLSRPLVAATGVGLLFDDVESGLFVGVFFELLYLGNASLGGAHPDHETLPAVMAAAVACGVGSALGVQATPAMWAVAILLCAPAGVLGRRAEAALDVRAKKYLGRARDATSAGDVARAARQNLRAMWPQFVFVAVCSAAAVGLGSAVATVLGQAPAAMTRGLAWAYPMLTVVAASLAVAHAQAKRRNWAALAFALAGAAAALYRNGVAP